MQEWFMVISSEGPQCIYDLQRFVKLLKMFDLFLRALIMECDSTQTMAEGWCPWSLLIVAAFHHYGLVNETDHHCIIHACRNESNLQSSFLNMVQSESDTFVPTLMQSGVEQFNSLANVTYHVCPVGEWSGLQQFCGPRL